MLPHGLTHGFVAQAKQKTFVGMEPQPCCHMSNFPPMWRELQFAGNAWEAGKALKQG